MLDYAESLLFGIVQPSAGNEQDVFSSLPPPQRHRAKKRPSVKAPGHHRRILVGAVQGPRAQSTAQELMSPFQHEVHQQYGHGSEATLAQRQ